MDKGIIGMLLLLISALVAVGSLQLPYYLADFSLLFQGLSLIIFVVSLAIIFGIKV